MTQYARDTKVSTEASEMEIRRLLVRYGADQFYSAWDAQSNMSVVGFRVESRHVKMLLPLPDPSDREYTHTPGRNLPRDRDSAFKAWEQACRQKWRALVLIVKAKLEAVESGISTIEREFLADIQMPDGRTIYEWAAPQVEQMYISGKMPPLLPAGKD